MLATDNGLCYHTGMETKARNTDELYMLLEIRRGRMDLSKRAFCRLLGIALSTYIRWAKHEYMPGANMVETISWQFPDLIDESLQGSLRAIGQPTRAQRERK